MTLGKIAVIVGVGPGIGGKVAERFAADGYKIALISRSKESCKATHDNIVAKGGKSLTIAASSGSETDIKRAYSELVEHYQASPEVLVFNVSGPPVRQWPPPKFVDIKPAVFQETLNNGVVGALVWIQQVIPAQVAAGKGTILLTGATASVRGGAAFPMFSPVKFALRSLGQSVAREFQPKGIHVAHILIDGSVLSPAKAAGGKPEDQFLLPEHIAEEYWKLHTQHPSTWTQELDLRPFTEKF